jgi:hypothetical protein
MGPFSHIPSGQGPELVDPRLQPTPDYGTLGPGSDVKVDTPNAPPSRPDPRSVRRAQIIAILLGGLFAFFGAGANLARRSLPRITDLFGKTPSVTSAKDFRQLDRLRPQKQAEALLQLAVANSADSDAAREQILARVDRWRGKLDWGQLTTLLTAALNSKDMRVREAGIEVELAAYGLSKKPSTVDYLVSESHSTDHARKIWGMWALALMANRGIDTDRGVEVLVGHLKDSDADSRRWAVEAVAMVGTTPTIPVLLHTMHDDPSPLVRERAACSLAESGMLTHEQRLTAVPQLLNYTDDPSLDAQTHNWAFRALGDITEQRLPNDSAAWRGWYENNHTISSQ